MAQRTSKQQAALEVYCRMVAEELNEKGITMTQFFKGGFEVPFSQQIVKDHLWKPIQKVVLGIESTTDADTCGYNQVFEPLNLKLADWGIHVPWPEKE